VTFFCCRQYFESPKPPGWGHKEGTEKIDMAFLKNLCTIACTSSTKLIYQDYSGRLTDDLYESMLVQCDHPSFKSSVLFDVTYKDAGCFIDFSKINIFRNSEGDFIQPAFETLTFLRSYVPSMLSSEMKRRRLILADYVHRYYQVLIGKKEPRDWCSSYIISERMKPMVAIYGTSQSTDSNSLYELLESGLLDFCTATECHMTGAEMHDVIQSDQYVQTLKMLSNI
jgi:hypothetical protein